MMILPAVRFAIFEGCAIAPKVEGDEIFVATGRVTGVVLADGKTVLAADTDDTARATLLTLAMQLRSLRANFAAVDVEYATTQIAEAARKR